MDLHFDENLYDDTFTPIICSFFLSFKKFAKAPLKITTFLISEQNRLKCSQFTALLIMIVGWKFPEI